ncbi:O-antigen ligase family protein [Candidatus Bipolaricaulota bacterium]|nr:O-antigen ligase family protein [Candidatus Bipolaricaulota bacterium]
MDKGTKALDIIFRKMLLPVAIISGGLIAAYLALEISPGALIALLVLSIGGFLMVMKIPEVAFGLFLLAGFYKADPSIPLPVYIDLTVLFGVLAVIGIVIRISRSGYKIQRIPNKFFLPYLGLVLLMLASLLYTGAPNYGTSKFLRFSIITALATFGPIFLFTTPDRFKRFLYTLIVVSTAMVLDSYMASSPGFQFHMAFGSNYIALARITGITVLLAIYYFIMLATRLKGRLFWIALVLINLFGLLYAGARGPVVALVLTIGFITLLSVRWRFRRSAIKVIQGAFALFLVAILFVFFYPNAFSTLTSRMELILPGGSLGTSVNARLNAYDKAINAIGAAPLLGQGIGGFSKYALGTDVRLYPHNIFLEIGSELGAVGLGLFLTLITPCFIDLVKMRKRSNSRSYFLITTLLALFIFTLINASVSGDINDNRLFFVWLGTTYAFALGHKKGCYD